MCALPLGLYLIDGANYSQVIRAVASEKEPEVIELAQYEKHILKRKWKSDLREQDEKGKGERGHVGPWHRYQK